MRSSHSFYLNKRSIYVQYSADGIEGRRMQEPTGLLIDPVAYKAGKIPKAHLAVMNRIATKFALYEDRCNLHGKAANADEVRTLIREATGRDAPAVKGVTLAEYVERFLKDVRAGKVLKDNGKKYSKAYAELGDAILVRLKDHRLGQKPLSGVGVPDLRAFAAALVARGSSQNTVATYVNSLAGYIRQGKKGGLHNGPDIGKGARVQPEDVEYPVYLNAEEQAAIARLGPHKGIRDAFLLGCQLGMRHSDFFLLTPQHRQGDKVNTNTKKTGAPVWVPLSPMAAELWDKCGGVPAVPQDSNTMADWIRKMGKAAGLDSEILFSRTEGGVKVQRWKKKWELLSTHTMRRSFATNAYKAGVPIAFIMKVTGHKTIAAFMRYIRISGEENADLLLQHAHFK